MGVDYVRFKPKPNADLDLLESLIKQQAVAFQTIYGWNSVACYQVDALPSALRNSLHRQSYIDASQELRTLIDIPAWDRDSGCATDLSDLALCHRFSPIAANPAFPPLWRLRAQRTMLPLDLQAEIECWKIWISELQTARHDDYLRHLLLHQSSDFLRYHWALLRTTVMKTLDRNANWTKNEELIAVRQEILLLPEPGVSNPPIDPLKSSPAIDEPTYERTISEAVHVLELTRLWNRKAKGNFKLPDYRGHYRFSLEEMKMEAANDWLMDFLAWAERCVELGFGLYLDY